MADLRLLTVGSLPPEWGGPERGGVATFHAALLAALGKRRGIRLVGTLTPTPPRHPIDVPIVTRPEGIGTADFYEQLLERLEPDVVLMNHFANTIGVAHARLADRPPAVGVAHSWHNITFQTGSRRRHARSTTEEALAGLAAAVVPSRHCRRESERLRLSLPPETRTIHYPLPGEYLGEGPGCAVDGGRRGVLYVGGLIERKNPARLIEAAASLPGLHATLVGGGVQEGDLRALIDALGVADRVRLDRLDGDDHRGRLRKLYLSAEALCLPSSSESFGIVFIEALACGTPVVGFGPTVREIQEAMGIEVGEALDELTPATIAAAVERIRGATWNRAELRQAALEAFGPARTTERYSELLLRVGTRERLQ